MSTGRANIGAVLVGSAARSDSRYTSPVEQRRQISRVLRDNHTFRAHVPAILADVYPSARQRAAVAMGELGPLLPVPRPRPEAWGLLDPQEMVRRSLLPLTCPWRDDEVLDHDFWPRPTL
jgi:Domain of unknown function DUF29